MKVFETRNKINFVDDNNIFVGFDYHSSCCEDFGYLFSKQIPETLEDINNDLSIEFKHEDYSFHPSFSQEMNFSESYNSNEIVVFKLIHNTESDNIVYLILYNHHNGYYSHGFEMKNGEKVIVNGEL